MRFHMKRSMTLGVLSAFLGVLAPARSGAHCDGLDGPVVASAREALETETAAPALMWVRAEDEAEVKQAFQKTLAVRRLNPAARELADRYFFETLVRVHRAGEGAPYTGLKPAGRDLGAAIPAGDRALRQGDAAPVRDLLTEAVREGLDERFRRALSLRDFKPGDVAAGRAYARAYVEYIHYVEGIHGAARGRHAEAEGEAH